MMNQAVHMVLIHRSPFLPKLPCVCHGWAGENTRREGKEKWQWTPPPHHSYITQAGLCPGSGRQTKINSWMRLVAFNGKVSTKLFLNFSSGPQVTQLMSTARAGSSLKATHSCFSSFQPLSENSRQRTYPQTLPDLYGPEVHLWRKKLNYKTVTFH